jgi:hypothetical protein
VGKLCLKFACETESVVGLILEFFAWMEFNRSRGIEAFDYPDDVKGAGKGTGKTRAKENTAADSASATPGTKMQASLMPGSPSPPSGLGGNNAEGYEETANGAANANANASANDNANNKGANAANSSKDGNHVNAQSSQNDHADFVGRQVIEALKFPPPNTAVFSQIEKSVHSWPLLKPWYWERRLRTFCGGSLESFSWQELVRFCLLDSTQALFDIAKKDRKLLRELFELGNAAASRVHERTRLKVPKSTEKPPSPTGKPPPSTGRTPGHKQGKKKKKKDGAISPPPPSGKPPAPTGRLPGHHAVNAPAGDDPSGSSGKPSIDGSGKKKQGKKMKSKKTKGKRRRRKGKGGGNVEGLLMGHPAARIWSKVMTEHPVVIEAACTGGLHCLVEEGSWEAFCVGDNETVTWRRFEHYCDLRISSWIAAPRPRPDSPEGGWGSRPGTADNYEYDVVDDDHWAIAPLDLSVLTPLEREALQYKRLQRGRDKARKRVYTYKAGTDGKGVGGDSGSLHGLQGASHSSIGGASGMGGGGRGSVPPKQMKRWKWMKEFVGSRLQDGGAGTGNGHYQAQASDALLYGNDTARDQDMAAMLIMNNMNTLGGGVRGGGGDAEERGVRGYVTDDDIDAGLKLPRVPQVLSTGKEASNRSGVGVLGGGGQSLHGAPFAVSTQIRPEGRDFRRSARNGNRWGGGGDGDGDGVDDETGMGGGGEYQYDGPVRRGLPMEYAKPVGGGGGGGSDSGMNVWPDYLPQLDYSDVGGGDGRRDKNGAGLFLPSLMAGGGGPKLRHVKKMKASKSQTLREAILDEPAAAGGRRRGGRGAGGGRGAPQLPVV